MRYYVGSDEEKEDLLAFYVEFKGNMDKIIENMFFADVDQEARYVEIIEKVIKEGQVKQYSAFSKTRNSEKRWKKAKKEALEAQAHATDLGLRNATLLRAGDILISLFRTTRKYDWFNCDDSSEKARERE